MRNLLFGSIFFIGLLSHGQQVCFLGIGGHDNETIAEVFQLNEQQLENLKNWSAELKFRNEIFELRAENLLKTHAQSSPEDLMKMSFDYRGFIDSIKANMRLLDKRMLSTFNTQQYNLYVQLCNSIYRSPIYTSRSVNEK
ncbi:MAG: hypothetical protein KJN65_11060 [Croceitalea sp.]|nr:hypothetical protein [Croceitalea sp.]